MIDFRFIVITDSSIFGIDYLLDRIVLLCKSGIPAIQVREKNLSSNLLLQLSKKISHITHQYNVKLIINDRLDIAMLTCADGLHSPENGVSCSQIKMIPYKLFKGKSVHSLNAAIKAEHDGFDYVIAGPVFKTPSKSKYGKPIGLNVLKEITSNINIPVFAVGGITTENAAKCIKNGAFGIAGIREFINEKKIERKIKFYNKLFD